MCPGANFNLTLVFIIWPLSKIWYTVGSQCPWKNPQYLTIIIKKDFRIISPEVALWWFNTKIMEPFKKDVITIYQIETQLSQLLATLYLKSLESLFLYFYSVYISLLNTLISGNHISEGFTRIISVFSYSCGFHLKLLSNQAWNNQIIVTIAG